MKEWKMKGSPLTPTPEKKIFHKRKFRKKRPVRKPRTRWKDVVPEGHITDSMNTRMGETSRRLRIMEASSEGDQGPIRGCSDVDRRQFCTLRSGSVFCCSSLCVIPFVWFSSPTFYHTYKI